MNTETNYDWCYQTLKLRPGASLEKIKQRYRELARRYHPDTVPPAQQAQATYHFQQINLAKETLEEYWEVHHCPPISESQQRFQEAFHHRKETQRQRTEAPWRPHPDPLHPTRRQQPYETKGHRAATVQAPPTPSQTLATPLLDRILIIIVAETSIALILWSGYHLLSNLHLAVTGLQAYTADGVMFKLTLGFLILALVVCGYLASIALILLSLLLLVIPLESILQMFAGRRKRPPNPYPHLTRPYPSRRKW